MENAPVGVVASCQATFALPPGAKENCTQKEIGAMTGDSYCHWRNASMATRLKARRTASLLETGGNAEVCRASATRPD